MKGISLSVIASLLCITAFSQETYLQKESLGSRLINRYEIKASLDSRGDASALKLFNKTYISCLSDSIRKGRAGILSKTDIKNLEYLEIETATLNDSVARSKHKLPFNLYNTKANLLAIEEKGFQLYVNPGLNLQYGYYSGGKPLYTNTRGLEIRGEIDDLLGFYTFISENQLRSPSFEREYFDSLHTLPGAHLVKKFKEHGFDFFTASGYITFKVLPSINVQFGQGRNFIGHGKRSLLLSDFATDYLFLKLNTRVWKLNYQNIYAKLIDRYGEPKNPWPAKYLVAHYLGIDLTSKLNVGFYESAVFHDNENTGRGFDLYYLNPIIFYRSVEHLLGDADKMMVGVNASWIPFSGKVSRSHKSGSLDSSDRHPSPEGQSDSSEGHPHPDRHPLSGLKLYGQLMINEFRFNDLRAGKGNANDKYGYQLGMYYIDIATISNLDLQLEYNRVRPYSYAHRATGNDTYPVNSYSHYNQPLAHPLGANFSEVLASLTYQPAYKLTLQLNAIAALYGADTATTNWGKNIFLDYRTYEQELGNHPAQGIKTHLTILEFTTTYQLKHNLFIDLEVKYRDVNSELLTFDRNEYYAGTSLRLNLEGRGWGY